LRTLLLDLPVYGVTPPGRHAAAGEYGKTGTHMSVADIVDVRSLDRVRTYKKHQKQSARKANGKAAT
jgi:hypothetical protein